MKKVMKKSLNYWPILVPVVFFAMMALFYATTNNQLKYTAERVERSIEATVGTVGELKQNDEVRQRFVPQTDTITSLSVVFGTYVRENTDILDISIATEGAMIFHCSVDTSTLQDNNRFELPISTPLEQVRGKELELVIRSTHGSNNNAVTLYYSSVTGPDGHGAYYNQQAVPGSLNMQILGKDKVEYAQSYWTIVLILLCALIVYEIKICHCEKRGQGTLAGNAVRGVIKYNFLLRQLVARDFKTKYKRSVLGMLWSLLNPLLTMTVQYIVFSTLFRFEIPNYPVYLLSGIVFFNYMSDATSQAMMCIINNASLINKVYVPKYIYPLSKVLSCGVNFMLSLVALYIMILFTGITITPAHLFLIYGIFCTFLFVMGVSFLLSALMVVFRDIQFLYSIFLQMWIYLTPLFYPESILPEWVMGIVKVNPMYHFIRFIRIIVLDGVLPEFKAWVFCGIFAVIPFVIGYYVFRKMQKNFILYI